MKEPTEKTTGKSPYWSKRVAGLEPYTPGEQPRDRRYIKLNTNENPYPPSPKVLEAIRAAAQEDLRLYPDPTCLALRSAIAARYGLPGADWVFVGNGSDEILAFAFAAFFGSRDRMERRPLLFPDITYSFYPVYADLWDIEYETVPVTEKFEIDTAHYRRPASGVVLANPNAPTGRALGKGALTELAAFHQQEQNVLLIDEAYVDFGAESMADQVQRYDNLLVVHTLSKSRSLAGLRVGYALGQPDLIEGLRRIKDSFNSYTLDRLALAGAQAAIEDREYYDAMAAKIEATRENTRRALEEAGFEVIPSAANFIFIRHPERPGAELFQALRSRGILVRHWNKPRISEYLRVSIGTDEEMESFVRICRGNT
ncbi:MAG: histidinol-phosphate transaminase [Treponema sp.]|nr:histidinol-phosphate transaminase [Treponema sp.]